MAVTINASTSTGLVQSADTSGEIELQSNGTTALKVNTNEGIQILNCLGVGNATPSTSGAGITFPATQSASSDANTLDDYEEGTWAPTYNTANSNANVTYSLNSGWYVKIGQLVNFGFQMNFATVTSAGTGDVQFRGLPFTIGSLNNGGRYVVQTSDLNATSYQNIYAYPPGGTVLQLLGQTNNTSWSVLSPSTFTVRAGSIITVIGFYNV